MRTALLLPFEILRILEGHTITSVTTEGDPVRLTLPGWECRHNLGEGPKVEVTRGELLIVAKGHVIALSGAVDLLLKIPTVGEYRDVLARARAWHEEHGIPCPPDPTDEEILSVIGVLPELN